MQNGVSRSVAEKGRDQTQFLGFISNLGYLIFISSNEETASYLKDITSKIIPWENATFKAASERFGRHTSLTVSETILQYLKAQNVGLKVERWEVLQREQQRMTLSYDTSSPFCGCFDRPKIEKRWLQIRRNLTSSEEET